MTLHLCRWRMLCAKEAWSALHNWSRQKGKLLVGSYSQKWKLVKKKSNSLIFTLCILDSTVVHLISRHWFLGRFVQFYLSTIVYIAQNVICICEIQYNLVFKTTCSEQIKFYLAIQRKVKKPSEWVLAMMK